MTVHVGRISSEVTDTARPEAAAPTGDQASPWAEQATLESAIEQATRDRLRTSTGHGDD